MRFLVLSIALFALVVNAQLEETNQDDVAAAEDLLPVDGAAADPAQPDVVNVDEDEGETADEDAPLDPEPEAEPEAAEPVADAEPEPEPERGNDA